jgi:cell division inhibitor SepF
MWKKAMTYLGLGEDEDYVDYDEYDEPAPEPRRPVERRPAPVPERRSAPVVRDEAPEPVHRPHGTVRAIAPEPRPTEAVGGVGAVTARGGIQRGAVVRPLPVPVTAKPHIVVPTSFNEAQEVADKFKGNVPVIMNLQELDKELSRRLIDFASGLCYGLGGTMERVANSVYLLTPTDVEVSAEEKQRLQERGFSS